MIRLEIGVFEKGKLVNIFQFEGTKSQVIKWLNETIKLLTTRFYLCDDRCLMYKIYSLGNHWYTLEELVEKGVIVLANAKN